MSIEEVWIPSDYPLEGVLSKKSKSSAAIICHPHPLYGGSMENNVVCALEEGFSSVGFTTLKFNFRGVGKSKGFYGGGEGELRDLIYALKFIESIMDEAPRIVLAGYSFGAWICTMAFNFKNFSDLFLVSYPFAFYEPEKIANFRKKIYFVCGSYDNISPPASNLHIYRMLPQIEKFIKIIKTDHFYLGVEKEIIEFITRVFS